MIDTHKHSHTYIQREREREREKLEAIYYFLKFHISKSNFIDLYYKSCVLHLWLMIDISKTRGNKPHCGFGNPYMLNRSRKVFPLNENKKVLYEIRKENNPICRLLSNNKNKCIHNITFYYIVLFYYVLPLSIYCSVWLFLWRPLSYMQVLTQGLF